MKFPTFTVVQNLYIRSTLTIIGYVCILLFFVYPLFEEIRDRHELFEQKKEEIYALEKAGSTPQLLKRQIQNAEIKLTTLHASVLQQGKEIDFIRFLEELSKEHSVSLIIHISEQKQKAEPTVSFAPLELSVTAEGLFFDGMEFISALESSLYYAQVTSIEVRPRSLQTTEVGLGALRFGVEEDTGAETPQVVKKEKEKTRVLMTLRIKTFVEVL